jgi:hypothetical protein
MGLLDTFTPLSRRWRRISKEATEAIFRAAGHQARTIGIRDPAKESARLVELYKLQRRAPRWQEFGDLGLHLTVSYPPDLAYVVLYGLRGVVPDLGYDPVPLLLKALEEMYGFRPSRTQLQTDASILGLDEFNSPEGRAKKAAQILARELSTVPLRYASGIWVAADPKAKPFIYAALSDFNPRAAKILSARPKTWWLTPTGAARGLLGILFGKDET